MVYRFGGLAALGAVLGTTLRYYLALIIPTQAALNFPWPTLTVNILGSLIIGWCATQAAIMSHDARRHFLVTGVLGGFTTFSAFALDLISFNGSWILWLGYVAATFAGGLAATHLGWRVGSR